MLARMKQRTSNNSNGGGYEDFSEREYEIAEVLIQLPQLIRNSELNYLVQLSWGAKRRRTAIFGTPSSSNVSPSSPPSNHLGHHQSLPPPPPPPSSKMDVISSPNTPLSFLPHSDSDSKPNKSLKRKLPKKKTKEEWLDLVREVQDRNYTFKKEIETVQEHYNTLLAQNLKLKSMLKLSEKGNGLQELNLFVEEPTTTSAHQQQQPLGVVAEPRFVYQQQQQTPYQFIDLKPQFESESSRYLQSQITMGQLGPSRIPDLNANHDEHETICDDNRYNNSRLGGVYQPFDDDLRKRVLTSRAAASAASAAAARKARYEASKVKKSAKSRIQNRL